MAGEDLKPRVIALEILNEIMFAGKDYSALTETGTAFDALPAQDKAWISMTLLTCLRRMGQINDIMARFVTKEPSGKAKEVLNIIRLGAVQAVFMETPPHAVVNTSVELAAARGFTPMKGMVNAVLRRICEKRQEIAAKQDAAKLNMPGWLWNKLAKDWGAETARRISLSMQEQPALDITPLKKDGVFVNALELPTGSVRLNVQGAIKDLPGYNEGNWQVQDAAAAIPAKLFGDVKGKTVFDLCAAPGGKTAQLAAMGASVTAIDRSDKRLGRLRANMKRLSLNVNVVTADAALWQPPVKADAVLLDAPCSATGTLRRNPDVAINRTPADVVELVNLQKKLAKAASMMLKPGGVLVYCTCSLLKAEGEEIADFIVGLDGMRLLPLRKGEVTGIDEFIDEKGYMRIFPYFWGGMDGFFAARFERV